MARSEVRVLPPKSKTRNMTTSHRAAAGLESSVPARDIIASNFPHNINTQLLDTLSAHHTYISTTSYAPVFHSVLTDLRHGRRGSSSPAAGEGLMVLLPQGKSHYSHDTQYTTDNALVHRLLQWRPVLDDRAGVHPLYHLAHGIQRLLGRNAPPPRCARL
jgi:hypothetical protein